MNMMRTLYKNTSLYKLIALLCLLSSTINAQITLPSFFADHMVLQRDKLIKIWGTAPAGTAINISLHTQLSFAIADNTGHWEAILGALPAGGPYQLHINGTDGSQLLFEDIMMGEVWLCAGQSNMERPLKFLNNSNAEIADANWPNIRYFSMPKELASQTTTQVDMNDWQICSPETAGNLSGVAYFFARDLHADLGVSIGIVDVSWGGTAIDTWLSIDALHQVGESDASLPSQTVEELENAIAQQQMDWEDELETTDIGLMQQWQNDNVNWDSWPTMMLPKPWEADALVNRDGSVWFKKTFHLTASQATQAATLRLGRIDDSDQCWINGQLVGSTYMSSGAFRVYNVNASILQAGENTITVRVRDHGYIGGMLGPDTDMRIHAAMWQVSLVGHWHYREGTPNLGTYPPNLDPDDYPSLIYNGMLHPLLGLQIAGINWYQGESNTHDPFVYRRKLIKLIDSWRQAWAIGDIPFIVVQLPFFRPVSSHPDESSWATLRESQTFAYKRERTALVCTIDTGDAFDIHPNNKLTVGARLAQAAQQLVYDADVDARSPDVYTALPSGNEVYVFFRTYGSSLQSSDGDAAIRGFAIAGANGQFVWANASILNNQTVRVSHPSVPQPLYVRYAWADNPGALNLINAAGFPVIPFRTDEFTTPWE